MSRRRNKRPPAQQQRRAGSTVITQERPQESRRVPGIRPGATNFRPVSDTVIQSMYQNMGPQANPDSMYAPGAPLRPMPGLTPQTGIRGWDYQVGHNIGRLPRSTEVYSFADLRAMSQTYYGVQMCQQVWFDYISQLELEITPRKDLIGEDDDISMYADAIQGYKDFFAYPDREHDLHGWLQMLVKDQLDIDAVAIYPRKDRAGRLYSLDVIDAAMITPLVDDRGRKPLPPYPAYEQYVHGIPAALLTSDDLIYVKETERTDSVYGRSRVERIILNINVALRKQTKDLAHFTDGNLPPGFVTPSMDVQWSQEEIEAWEMQLNNLLAGNDELRARVKVLPRGFEYKAVLDPDIHVDLDQFLLNITAACHGLTMAELAFVADVNRSTGDSQENVVYRRAMGPLMKRYARLFTMILQKYFNERRFVVGFKGYTETEDLQSNATAYTTLTNAGILGLTDAAKLMKLPENPDAPYIGRVFFSKDGPVFLDDMASDVMRNAAIKAKLAGFDMAANPQAQTPADGTPGNGSSDTEEETTPALSRIEAQVEEILARLDRVDTPVLPAADDEGGDREEDDEDIEDLLSSLFDDDDDETERNWSAWDAAHPGKGQQHPTKEQQQEAREEQQKLAAQVEEQMDTLQQEAQQTPAQKAAARLARAKARAERMVAEAEARLARSIAKMERALTREARVKARGEVEAARAAAKLARIRYRTLLLHLRLQQKLAKAHHRGQAAPQLTQIASKREDTYTANDGSTQPSRVATQESETGTTLVEIKGLLQQALAQNYRYVAEETQVTSVVTTESASGDYKRWRARAIDDIKAGRTLRGFTTTAIPAPVHAWISDELEQCSSVEEVKHVFARAKANDLHWQDNNDGVQKYLATLKAQGITTVTWKAYLGACPECALNDGQTVPLGSRFASGAYIVPGHNHCVCRWVDNVGRRYEWTGTDGEYRQLAETEK